MRRRITVALVVLLLAAVSFGVVTLAALEGREVVILRTADGHGATHETRTWIAEDDGALLVEAANAARPFLADVRARPEIELRRGGDPIAVARRRCRTRRGTGRSAACLRRSTAGPIAGSR